jgi:hypothetical protein
MDLQRAYTQRTQDTGKSRQLPLESNLEAFVAYVFRGGNGLMPFISRGVNGGYPT